MSNVINDEIEWACPHCKRILEKPMLGKVVFPGRELSLLKGTAKCGGCGNQFPQRDVYGGKYGFGGKSTRICRAKYDPAQGVFAGGCGCFFIGGWLFALVANFAPKHPEFLLIAIGVGVVVGVLTTRWFNAVPKEPIPDFEVHPVVTRDASGSQSQPIPAFAASVTQNAVPTITSRPKWRCPNCNVLLTKGALGVIWQPGEALSKVHGTATCEKCGFQAAQRDVYGGKYDYVEQPATRTVICPGCHAHLKLLSDYRESTVACPGCKQVIPLS